VKKTVVPEVSEWPPATAETSTYAVQKGDSLSKIASRFGLTTKELAAVNGITNPNKIILGQKLIIPSPGSGIESKPSVTAVNKVPAQPAKASGNLYVVQKGDSRSLIAVRHKVTVKAIKELNGLTTDKILVGQKLQLPTAAPTVQAAAVKTPAAEVQPPKAVDTLDRAPIATAAKPAKTITPPAKTPTVPAPPAVEDSDAFRVHVVEEDDDLFSIAMMWNVSVARIKAVNGLTENEVKPGQKLKIPLTD